ncbi:MAG: twin-arginine translocase subunit TatB [Sphingomonas sp.]|jgi:sec-independent protein translocase protein TatB
MFDVAPSELIVLGAVALLVIPPKDLPKAMRVAGYWVGRARGVARQFRAGFDDMIRDSELKEMEARWAAENERIMREHPSPSALMLDAPSNGSVADAAPEPSPFAPHGAHAGEHGGEDANEDAPPVMTAKPVMTATPMAAAEPVDPASSPRAESPRAEPVAKPAVDPAP